MSVRQVERCLSVALTVASTQHSEQGRIRRATHSRTVADQISRRHIRAIERQDRASRNGGLNEVANPLRRRHTVVVARKTRMMRQKCFTHIRTTVQAPTSRNAAERFACCIVRLIDAHRNLRVAVSTSYIINLRQAILCVVNPVFVIERNA